MSPLSWKINILFFKIYSPYIRITLRNTELTRVEKRHPSSPPSKKDRRKNFSRWTPLKDKKREKTGDLIILSLEQIGQFDGPFRRIYREREGHMVLEHAPLTRYLVKPTRRTITRWSELLFDVTGDVRKLLVSPIFVRILIFTFVARPDAIMHTVVDGVFIWGGGSLLRFLLL